jgi:DNA polymerase (family 10)
MAGAMMENHRIADIFDEIADVLELQDESVFRIRSYRRGARAVRDLPEDVRTLSQSGELLKVPGIGKSLAEKVEEILATGTSKFYEKIKKAPEYGLLPLLGIPGIGPKHAIQFYRVLGVVSIDDLERAAKDGKLHELDRMGEKLEEKILKGIEQHRRSTGRFRLADGLLHAEAVVEELKKLKGVTRIDVAGSCRRMKETIGDIDILVISTSQKKVMDAFTGMKSVSDVIARGDTKSSVILRGGIQVDVRVLHKENYGAALHYFTGSQDHNVVIRDRGKRKGLRVSEYGVFNVETAERLGGATEEEVFAALGLPFIPPELRENNGEFEAADEGRLPRLVEMSDIRGDLHMHTDASDGRNTPREMALAAKKLGYKYIAITDHSQAVRVAGGLDAEELAAHIKAIRRAGREVKGIEVLTGVEVDIMKDGSLDLPDDVLRHCDVVVAAVHSGFNMPEAGMTRRILRAFENENVNILAHPTGRLIGEREPYEVDLEAVIAAAGKSGIALELNAFPDRLDLKDIHCRAARDAGAMISIGTDSHAVAHLENMRYGIGTARRGWCEPGHILNTMTLAKLRKFLAR